MRTKLRRLFAFLLVLVLLFSNTNVAFAAPGDGNSGDHTFTHLDVRIEGVTLSMQRKVINMVTGALVDTETTAINASLTKVEYVTINGVTYNNFYKMDAREWRQGNVSINLSALTEESTAVLVVDLVDDSGNTYNDVRITYNRDGIQYAMEHCDGYRNGRYDGIDFDPSQSSTYITLVQYDDYVIPVMKIWDDDNNRDGIRPASVTINLYANGELNDSVVLSEDNGWAHIFTGKPSVDANGAAIVYTIDEASVPAGYTKTDVGNNGTHLTVTNTHVPETISISGGKTWVDNDNQDGMRPESITVELYANGQPTGLTQTVTAEDGWAWTFDNILLNDGGVPIEYTVVEAAVDGYTPTYDGMNVTNTHEIIKTEVTVTKLWDDNDDQDGKRPGKITVDLYANGEKIQTVEITEENGWTYTFEDLDMYANGEEIVYTVVEHAVDGYESSVEGLTITNTHEIIKTQVPVEKVWVDADNQDGVRADSVTVHLLANNVDTGKTLILSADNNWKGSFTDLDMYAGGEVISYTITEDAVPNYTTAITGNQTDGYTITNSHETAKTEVPVTKIWNDADNQDGKRPEAITVNLMADGKVIDSMTITAATNWTGKFTDLEKYRDGGVEIVYTVEEAAVPAGYTVSYSEDTLTITNTHVPEVVTISGSKTWNDSNNQDGVRPASITINLLANGTVVDSREVTAANGWAWSFENMPKYKNGTEISYTISENLVEGYISDVNGYDVTNTHAPEKVSIPVNKVWNDADNQDGMRPGSVTVVLVADGVETEQELILSEGNNWTGSFDDLDKNKNGTEIVYTVKEVLDEAAAKAYTSAVAENEAGGYTITNTHTPETVEVSGSKTWKDNDNQDGVRPASITINLLANGTKVDSVTVNADSNWTWSFTDLPKYAAGQVIEYTITEETVEGYTPMVEDYNVTNSYTPEETYVSVTKVWLDNSDQDGIRPESITYILKADGEEIDRVTVTANEGWTYTFTGLPKYRDQGTAIVYTIEEVPVEGYESQIVKDENGNNVTVTNIHEPEVITISGIKTWDDNNDQDGKRPASITINLKANGEVVATQEVTEGEDGTWSWTFENLPKYEAGEEIVYSITENAVDEYEPTVDGYNVTNTHTPELTSVTVTKAWEDANNQDGIRPNDVVVKLLADGEETGIQLVLSEANNWSDTFTDLPKYADGVEIVYTVVEVPVEGYEAVVSDLKEDGYTITNHHTPATISISGSKIWDDNNDQDGARPASITIRLLANGKEVASVTVGAADNWAWSFEAMPKFEAGKEIVYSITEDAVDGYSAEYDGYNVTNTHTPEQTSITVTKAWKDENDQDGIRPDEITVILLANGEPTGEKLVLDEKSNWSGSFTELDKYADGAEIEYTVEEIKVDGYESTVSGNATKGYVITNSHTPEVTEISGTKTWNDNDNQDGVRPESITVNLMANGKVVKTATVTEADDWSYTFTNLPKYENGGQEIVYAVTEAAVDGYTTTYDGYNIINSYTPAETSVTVTKAWADSNNEDGLRPDKITITLYANGKLTDKTLVLTAEDNWSGSFVGLPKYEAGVQIVYTIGEVAVKDYNTVIRGNMTSGFVVTNSHTVIPQTGDERTPMLWMMLMLTSVAMVAYVVYDARKRRMAN